MKNITEELRAVKDLIIAGEFETEMEINEYDQLSLNTNSHVPDSESLCSLHTYSNLQTGEGKQIQL